MTRLPTDGLEHTPRLHEPRSAPVPRAVLITLVGLVAVAAATVPWTVVALVPVVGINLLRRFRRGSAPRRHGRLVQDQLAEVATLIAVGLGGGLPLRHVCAVLASSAPEPFRGALNRVDDRQNHGHGLIDALDAELTHLGGGAQALLPLLRAHADDGAPVSQALFEVAESSRQARRRASEAQARRLPVRMLVPLIVCVLPAFMALTIVPVIVESLRSFDL